MLLCIVVGVSVGLSRKKGGVPEQPSLPQTDMPDVSHLEECSSLVLNASSDAPSSYPCNPCVELFRNATAAGKNLAAARPVAQFCALMDLYETSRETQQGFYDSGWGLGVDPCNGLWKGIGCDKDKNVISL